MDDVTDERMNGIRFRVRVRVRVRLGLAHLREEVEVEEAVDEFVYRREGGRPLEPWLG